MMMPKVMLLVFGIPVALLVLQEVGALNKLKNKFENTNIRFIAISFDSKEDIERTLINHPFEFDLYHLDSKIINSNRLTFGYPTNLILNSNGKVLFRKSGSSTDPEKAMEICDILSEQILENLLKK